ncbi:MAG: hypothetical protein GYA17_00415 [Chloroflexi bacterium]|nr:hypothetical protein [Anaerolineaceae bacterium]NMB86787.1 hypothetical protein [Chloroflexota bacterium]
MSRYINTETAGKERTQLTRAVVLALRELMRQAQADDSSKDLAAFIALSLFQIHETVDASVGAWEKKGYWVKADRFRMEWEWTNRVGNQMKAAILADDWGGVAQAAVQVGQKLMNVQVPVRHKIGTPWVGAWKRLTE